MPDAGRIDCHLHYMPSKIGAQLRANLSGQNALRRSVADRPAWRDLDLHLEMMDRNGVQVSVILEYANELRKGLESIGGSLADAYAIYNQSMSEDLEATNGRIVACAAVDPFGGKEAIAALDRALSLPNIVGVGLIAGYNGMALDDPLFEPIFEVARHHDAPVMVHPSSVGERWIKPLRLDSIVLRSGFGFLLDDAMCIFRMATNGTFDRFHGVRFMFCQLGGFAPMCCGRWEYHRRQAVNLQQERGMPLPPWAQKSLGEYLSQLWLDTHTQDRHAIKLVIDEAGDHAIVLGGDHPYTPYVGGVPYALKELDALNLSAESRQRIERDNALKLLGPRVSGTLKTAATTLAASA
jgi:predicted TIM-barrel fold metal-dependent hydrolase